MAWRCPVEEGTDPISEIASRPPHGQPENGSGHGSSDDPSHATALIGGDGCPTASFSGCRMRNYAAGDPLTLANPRARVRAVACFNRDLELYER